MDKRILIRGIISMVILVTGSYKLLAQTKVAITIDDVPNTLLFEQDKCKSSLLERIDSLQVPVAIFINEGLVFKTDSLAKNILLLDRWIKSEWTTLGNHTFGHIRYSKSDIERFSSEVLKGETITRVLARKYGKDLVHFRFPYNDLGKDSIQQMQIKTFLDQYNYKITPFTIESSDWIFNAVYEYYLHNKQLKEAHRIGIDYIDKSIEYFKFFEELSLEYFDRNISQIFLCHDNSINKDYLPMLIKQLKTNNCEFIPLDEALKDEVYQLPNQYYMKWGISWFYRWITDKNERKNIMQIEPSIEVINKKYKDLKN